MYRNFATSSTRCWVADFRTKLADAVSSSREFGAAYDVLQRDSLSSLLNGTRRLSPALATKLLRSALIFAQSSRDSHFMLAQNIAYCLATAPITDEERIVCRHIMASVGNFPAGEFIASEVAEGCQLPWQLALSELARREGNTVLVSGKPELFTDFQEPVRFLVCRGHETITEITSYDRSNSDQEEQEPEGAEAVRRAVHLRHQLRSFNRPQHTEFLTPPRLHDLRAPPPRSRP